MKLPKTDPAQMQALLEERYGNMLESSMLPTLAKSLARVADRSASGTSRATTADEVREAITTIPALQMKQLMQYREDLPELSFTGILFEALSKARGDGLEQSSSRALAAQKLTAKRGESRRIEAKPGADDDPKNRPNPDTSERFYNRVPSNRLR